MTVQYELPYHNILADLLKDDDLTETEKKIFDVLASARVPFTRRRLAWMVFGGSYGGNTRHYKQEREIRDGIEKLQEYGAPIISCGYEYYLGNDPALLRDMIFSLESKISQLQDRVDRMRVCYGRQIGPFRELINGAK